MTVRLEIAERRMQNGLTLLAVRNPGVETFAARVVLDVDIRDEARGERDEKRGEASPGPD